MSSDITAVKALPEATRRQLCLDLLEAAGAVSIRVNEATGEIVHGCLLKPGAHGDQVAHPTASLNFRSLAGNCFGCGSRGGLLWFAAVVLRTDEAGVRRWLDGQGPVGQDGVMPAHVVQAAIAEAFKKTSGAAESIPRYHPSALEPFRHLHRYWTDPPAPPGLAGGGRGVHPDTVAARQLGYDPSTDRVVIPHFWRDELVGWQTRPAGPVPAGVPKYLNTPDFPRKSTLFNLDPDAEEVVLVESVGTVLPHAHAMDGLTGTFGAFVTDAQIGQIIRLRRLKRVILWPDSDTKGWDAVDGGVAPNNGLIRRLSPHVPVFFIDSLFSGDGGDLDTTTALMMRQRWVKPAALWRRPPVLYCPYCKQSAHPGACPGAEVGA